MATPEPVHVLLVEDHAQLRSILARVLKERGYLVTAVGNADEAVAAFEKEGVPDILFSDVRMPGRWSGVELAEWVGQTHPQVKILLQTGYAGSPTGRFKVLLKPFADTELLEAIDRLAGTPGAAPPTK